MSSVDVTRNHPPHSNDTSDQWPEEEWDTEATPVRIAPKLATTLSIRFEPESALLLRRAARLQGLTKSEFVRRSTIEAAHQVIASDPAPPVVITRLQMQSRAIRTGSTGPAHRAVPTERPE